jgi:hypothetical protein
MDESYTMSTSTTSTNIQTPFSLEEYVDLVYNVLPPNTWNTTTTSNTIWGPPTISNNSSPWMKPIVYHNTHGPAIFSKDYLQWFINGERIFSTKVFCKLANHTDESTMFWILTYGEKLPSVPAEYKYLPVDTNDQL